MTCPSTPDQLSSVSDIGRALPDILPTEMAQGCTKRVRDGLLQRSVQGPCILAIVMSDMAEQAAGATVPLHLMEFHIY